MEAQFIFSQARELNGPTPHLNTAEASWALALPILGVVLMAIVQGWFR